MFYATYGAYFQYSLVPHRNANFLRKNTVRSATPFQVEFTSVQRVIELYTLRCATFNKVFFTNLNRVHIGLQPRQK